MIFLIPLLCKKILFIAVNCQYLSKDVYATSLFRAVLPAPPLALSASIVWRGFCFFANCAKKSLPTESRKRKKKIGAANEIVEVDECYTSGGKGGRKVTKHGRGLNGKIAFAGAIERNGRRVRIERIICASRQCLSSFIARNIRSGSTVHTDSFKSYLDIPKYGYRHFRVNHFLTFKDSKSGACTNIIESVWAVMRRHWQRFCGGFRNNLNLWIAEIEWRIENRKNLPNALKKVLRRIWKIT